MAIDSGIPRSRRALLAGGLGGLAAVVATAVARAPGVEADDGDFCRLGQSNESTHWTNFHTGGVRVEGGQHDPGAAVGGTAIIAHGVNNGTGILATSEAGSSVTPDGPRGSGNGLVGQSGSGTGVSGKSESGIGTEGINFGAGPGVYGESQTGFGVSGFSPGEAGTGGSSDTGIGVYGSTGTGPAGVYGLTYSAHDPGTVGRTHGEGAGILGYSGPNSDAYSAPVKTGVYGWAVQDTSSRGVCGHTTAGQGVRGEATTGTGVFATATTGIALRAAGRVKIDKASGVATISTTKSSVTITPGIDVNSASFVLLTPKADVGSRRLWYTTNTTAKTITIKVSSAVTSNLAVGWLLLG